MNKKYIYAGIGIAVVLLLIFTIPKYFTGNVTASGAQISGDIEKIEVYHFHGTNQCYSCKTVGNYAEETINTYFSDELKSGKVVFASINIDLAENKELVDKYEAKGSSLIIGVYYKDGSFTYTMGFGKGPTVIITPPPEGSKSALVDIDWENSRSLI